jgi:hypothetical protein
VPKLVIHIGLAKTATTTLQRHFFPQAEGYLGKIDGLGPNGGKNPPPFYNKQLEIRFKRIFAAGPDRLREIAYVVSEIDFSKIPIWIISDESLTRWAQDSLVASSGQPVVRPSIREKPRRGAHPIVRFLETVDAALPPDVELTTVLTIRAQSTYLVSSASQLGVHNVGVAIRRIIRRNDEFILWHKLVMDLERLRGPEKHLTLLFEDGASTNAKKIADFCNLIPIEGEFNFQFPQPENVRRQTHADVWKVNEGVHPDRVGKILASLTFFLFRTNLPAASRLYVSLRRAYYGSRMRVEVLLGMRQAQITKSQRQKIREYCATSNRVLAKHLDRDLRSLGY